MHHLFWRRGRAYARDGLGYALIAVAEVPLGLALAGSGLRPTPIVTAALSSVPPVGALLWATWAERRPAAATWGKRAEGLCVAGPHGRPSTSALVVRNLVKITLPWTLGHVIAYSAAGGAFERGPAAYVLVGLLDALVGTSVVLAAVGSGRALHDRWAGTRVVEA